MPENTEILANERSEGGVLITQMNLLFAQNDWNYSSAVGELSVRTTNATDTRNETLFPDAIVYQDIERLLPVMGWEFKMPDVAINNEEFIANARDKADRLGTEVFVLWNFQYCDVYYRGENGDWPLAPTVHYADYADQLVDRQTVGNNEKLWHDMLEKVLSNLNADFIQQRYHVAPIAFHIQDYVDTIAKKLAPMTSRYMLSLGRPHFSAKIREWYRTEKSEFSNVVRPSDLTDDIATLAYAKNVVIRWVNRIIFGNLLRRHQNVLSAVLYDFDNSGDMVQFAEKLNEAVHHSDFYTILHVETEETYLPRSVIDNLLEFNRYLWHSDLSGVDSSFVSRALESMVDVTKRELMGLYTTPKPLAELLVQLTLVATDGHIADVTVGSGTIAKSLIGLLSRYKTQAYIHEHLWLSDKYSYPLQSANMNITSPETLDLMNIVFQHNALSLATGETVSVTDPRTGTIKKLSYPKINTITSNLPFVSSNNRADDDRILADPINSDHGLNARADLYQSILLHLDNLLEDSLDSRIGVIVSNSWMKNTAGMSFFDVLSDVYDIDSIVYSNVARWFDNASVVATILVLKKKTETPGPIRFIGVNVDIRDLDSYHVTELADGILSGAQSDAFEIYEYTVEDIQLLMSYGISIEGMFDDVNWLHDLIDKGVLQPIQSVLSITRGTRTGRDSIYITDGLQTAPIDSVPYVKTIKGLNKLKASTGESYMFYTTDSLAQIEDGGRNQTLEYIRSKSGSPDALKERNEKHKGEAWYIADDKPRYGDFITSINPDQKLFWAAFDEPTALNQRVVAATLKVDYADQRELVHALLNSVVGLYILGASGFSRAEGVTDLTSDGLKSLSILNPDLLSEEGKQAIVDAWHTVADSTVESAINQLDNKSWIEFNKIVFEQFGIDDSVYDEVASSIRQVMSRRRNIGTSGR